MANILIIEDSRSVSAAQAACLQQAGHKIHLAESGRAALQCLQKEETDLVLLDYELPDIDGAALFKQLQEVRPGMPVIMITGKGDEALAAHILRSGAKDYLIKSSVLLQNLARSVERVLEQDRLSRELKTKEAELHHAYAELEKKVAERTQALSRTNEKLEKEISYRRRVEIALHENNQQLLAIMDCVDDGFIGIDGDGVIGYRNSAMNSLLGLRKNDYPSQTLYEMLPELKGACPQEQLKAAMTDKHQLIFQLHLKRENRQVCYEVRLFPSASGATVRFHRCPARRIPASGSRMQA